MLKICDEKACWARDEDCVFVFFFFLFLSALSYVVVCAVKW